MSDQKIWADYTIYKVYRNDASYWEAAILSPTSHEATILNGEETLTSTVKQVRETYGESAVRLTEKQFQEEVERRTTHSPEMIELLKNNWTGQDLSSWHVYASYLRPMTGIKIDGAVYLHGNGARYQRYEIYTYVIAQVPLDAQTIEHYALIHISHPN